MPLLPCASAEQLLGVITCRRGDGREIALDRLPLAEELRGAETVRAEEIELSVPDGRRVTTLINATPIHGEDGAVASVVVTMQDLAPLQALERMRAEFLGMVSHELRVPLTSIKGSTAAALGAARLVAPAETREFFRRHCQVDENHVDRPPRYWALARRGPTMLGIKNSRQPQLDCDTPGRARVYIDDQTGALIEARVLVAHDRQHQIDVQGLLCPAERADPSRRWLRTDPMARSQTGPRDR